MRWRRMKPMKKTSMDAYCAIQSLFVPASLRQSVPLSAPVRHDPPPLFVSLQTEEKGAGANAPQSGEKVVLGYAQARAVAQQSRAEQSRAEQSRAEQSRASNTVLLGRSSEDCCLRKASSATGDSAVHKANKANTTDTTYPAQLGGACRFAGGASRLGELACASSTDKDRGTRRAVFSSRGTRDANGGRRDSIFRTWRGGHFSDFELKST